MRLVLVCSALSACSMDAQTSVVLEQTLKVTVDG